MGISTLRKGLAVSHKTKQTLYETFLLAFTQEKMKTYVYKKTCIRTFMVALFIMAPKWKTPSYPST